jgi:hypothetical protein
MTTSLSGFKKAARQFSEWIWTAHHWIAPHSQGEKMTTLPAQAVEEAMIGGADLFGPAPVLSTEDAGKFQSLLQQVTAALKPLDVVELILIRSFVIEVWTIERLRRHATVAIDRRYQEDLEHMLYRAKVQKARKDGLDIRTFAHATPRDIATLAAFAETPEEILTRPATESDHNRALEKSIDLQMQLDTLMASATHRRSEALQQLELYRAGLAAQAKEVTDRIVEGEFQEVTPVSAKPPILIATEAKADDRVESARSDGEAE